MSASIAERDMENRTATPSLDEAMQRGLAAAQRGEREEANRIFRETVEIYPEAVDVWVWLGGTSADLDEAEIAFEQASSLDPGNEKAALGLRWVQLRRGTTGTAESLGEADTKAQPTAGAPVQVPTQPALGLDTLAGSQPHEDESTAQPGATPSYETPVNAPSANEQISLTPEPARRTSATITWVILAVMLVALVALGYWYLFMR